MENDSYWGIGKDGEGENQLGVILERLRVKLVTDPSIGNLTTVKEPTKSETNELLLLTSSIGEKLKSWFIGQS